MSLSSESTVRRFVIPVVFTVLLGGFFVTTTASAEPQVTQADVEAAFDRAEAANEKVNQLVEDQKDLKRRIKAVKKEIAAIETVHIAQRDELGASIVQQQLEQPLGPTIGLLASKDPSVFISGLSALDALNSTRAEAIAAFSATKDALDQRNEQLQKHQRELNKAKKEADKQRAVLEAEYQQAKSDFALLDAATQAGMSASDIEAVRNAGSGAAKRAIAFAMNQLGDPYVYGGTGPNGWDCSGLVMRAYGAAGVSLPRVVGPQMAASRSISRAQLQPGDLVAYPSMSHIGIYLGGGKVIHAPRPGKTVEITSINSGFGVFARPVG